MATTRFHKAAQDGNIALLRDATRRECNARDEDGMSATMWAAACGRLEALRLLVGRGGEVEKACRARGRSALHHAAAGGHVSCVAFLIGFGANLWSLDDDLRTPLQLATTREVADIIDKAQASQTSSAKKEVKAAKERASKEAERRLKKRHERERKERRRQQAVAAKQESKNADSIVTIGTDDGDKKTIVEVGGPTFTEIVAEGTVNKKSLSVKRILDRRLRPNNNQVSSTKNSVKNGSQIIYVNSYENTNSGKRGKLTDVFDGGGGALRVPGHQQGGMFDRPGFGSVAFRHRANLAGTLSGCPDDAGSGSSIGSAGSLVGPRATPASDDDDDDSESGMGSVRRFLAAAGLEEYAGALAAQRVDLDALLILNDQDLADLGLPMGPRKKLLHAVEQRKAALQNPGQLSDSKV